MPLYASTGPVLAYNGMFMGILPCRVIQHTFNVLIAALAAVFAITTTVTVVMEIRDVLHHHGHNSRSWCISKVGVRTASYYTSMFLLLSMGVTRLVIGLRTTKTVVSPWLFLALVALSVLISLPFAIDSVQDDAIGMIRCEGDYLQLVFGPRRVDDWSGLFIATMIAFAITVIAYGALIIVLQGRERKKLSNITLQSKRSVHVMTTKVAAWVIFLFIISSILPYIAVIVNDLNKTPSLHLLFHYFLIYDVMIYIQAGLHPIIYFLQNEQFQSAAKGLLARFTKLNRVGDVRNNTNTSLSNSQSPAPQTSDTTAS